MPGFLYFLPNAKVSDVPANLKSWGLGYLIDGEDQTLWHRGATIAGVHGLVIGSSRNWEVEEVKASDKIEWVKFPKPFAEQQAWLGWIKDRPMPGPDDLARAKQISGELTTLADGNRWLLPIAKQYTEDGYAVNLPVCFGLNEETGDWITDSVVPQYRAIWNHANQYLNARLSAVVDEDGKATWTIPDGEKLVEDALQTNYRVSIREIASLGLLVSGIFQLVGEVLIDSHGWGELKKKAEADTGPG